MDKENGKNNESTNSSKASSAQDPTSILDAASLFNAYWPSRGGADSTSANAANLFAAAAAAAGGFGLPHHPAAAAAAAAAQLPFAAAAAAGMLPGSASAGRGPAHSAAGHSYGSNAYTNTLSVAASQAASLGMPSASAAWWSMASHLAAQDYLARLQASGLSFPGGALGSPSAADLSYPSLGMLAAAAASAGPHGQQHHHHHSKATKSGRAAAHHSNRSMSNSKTHSTYSSNRSIPSSRSTMSSSSKYSASSLGLTIQPTSRSSSGDKGRHHTSNKMDGGYPGMKPSVQSDKHHRSNSVSTPGSKPSSPAPSLFTSPLGLSTGVEKGAVAANGGTPPSPLAGGGVASLPSSILSDPSSILGGVRLPPDTEIIKYTSSIVGPKVPGTTNRGRKKTISLDPPSVSLHPSHSPPVSQGALLADKAVKRLKITDDLTPPNTPTDRIEVIKLPATNGSPSILSFPSASDSSGDSPLNLSLKPSTMSTTGSSSLNSLSNMSANIGVDRISRRKPGPKPRRVPPTTTGSSSNSIPPSTQSPGAPSASLAQLFAAAAAAADNTAPSPSRPPSRTGSISDGGSSTSSSHHATSHHSAHHKESSRPRNLGRGVSKPKKNTVASLLAQSRAMGLKQPTPLLDSGTSSSSAAAASAALRSNYLAAHQYASELAAAGGGEDRVTCRLPPPPYRAAAHSDSSTVDASDSDNLTDSNYTDSEMEAEATAAVATASQQSKKQKQYDEVLLRMPLEKGWKRETVIRGVTKNGGLKGDVTYSAPDSSNKFKQMSDVTQYLEYQKCSELTRDNFTFSCRVILGDYLQPLPPEMQTDGNEFLRLTEEDVTRRLDELKAAMRTSLPVEQRIELARKQQAARAAARLDREQQRINKEIERSERQEAARRERELKAQQMLEAKRKRQEEMEKQKQEEQQRKQQERELKRQQAALLKEQERERRRQHMALVKAMESRRKLEERERKKQQLLAEKQANKEKKLEQRKIEMEILAEIRKPCEDLELDDQKPLPEYNRIPGLKLAGKAFGDILMVFEFLHTFGETLGFDMESLPTLDSLQQALMPNEHSLDAEEELFSVMTHLLVCAIEDPGIPNPARHTTILGQSLRQADITHANLSEILRIYLYANATGEVKALTGVHFERDREKRVADHHQNDIEMQQTQSGKNSQYYELLHGNPTYKMSDLLKDKPFMSLSPTDKAAILAFICNELLQNKAVIKQIENTLESVAHQKKEKWLLDNKIRKVKVLHSRKVRSEAVEKPSHNKTDNEDSVVDSLSLLHKDDLLDDEDNEMSENESVGTQPEEEEDNKLSGEELGKKLEKLLKTSETQLQTLNSSSQQLRATCFGEDRYFRRYWTLPKSGGIYVEAMESAEPEEFENQMLCDQNESVKNGIKNLNELSSMMNDSENASDSCADKEVKRIIGEANIAQIDSPENKAALEHESEHRKTPNRLEVFENGEISDRSECNLAELKRSVDDIVQNLERNIELEKERNRIKEESPEKTNCTNSVKSESDDESIGNKKFNLFEKLGQCMERENKSGEELEADVKAEIKEELKNEILNELKLEIKNEIKTEHHEESEHKWFSILHKDGSTCDEVHLTAGNKWDNGNVGACTKEITELKIPVFPPPGTNNSLLTYHTCDSPAPLQMTNEESEQLEHIKKYGMPKPCSRKSVPLDKRYGWWRIADIEQLKEVLDNLHVRGVRERELKRGFLTIMQQMYEKKGQLFIEEGSKDLTELIGDHVDEVSYTHGYAPVPDEPGSWNQSISHRADMFLLEQIEALEDKVASASMQVKGWKVPNREDNEEFPQGQVLPIVKERLASLEVNIERRYLKPPLGVNVADPNLAAMGQETAGAVTPAQPVPAPDEIPKGLVVWREAVNRAFTSAQLAMCLYSLEASIAWDKSIMKAVSLPFCLKKAPKYNAKLSNCQFCHSGDNEDKLLLCDSCDRGYHTYCFKPVMDNIPEGDWYCHECMNKATGEKNCIVCGKKTSSTGTRLLVCEFCPRAYHTDCIRPQLHKAPRGKWYCNNCISKKPQKKSVKKNHNHKPPSQNESFEHCPSSPTPSHSSVTTNEDQSTTNCNQSDISNSSLVNASSPPSAQQCSAKKDKSNKKLMKELAPCKIILEDLECHDDAWPFLLPVNTKQFPTYKKIIKIPMDLSTIKKRLQDLQYKSREEFCADVRQIFNNCETFNEDDSPVGKAGHCMRQFFEARWNELCVSHS